MASANAKSIAISLDHGTSVSGLLEKPRGAKACMVLAHGAGGGMTHPIMAAVAKGLGERSIASLRYQFPYMEQGGKRPDPPQRAHAAVRAAAAAARRLTPGVPLFAGGKSFGGRMTSQAQALAPLPDVRGMVFFGFPLHPAGRPSQARAKHLFDVRVPMLFLQGTRDALAELPQLKPICDALGSRATLALLENADHSFHAAAKFGRSDTDIRNEMLDVLADWMMRMYT